MLESQDLILRLLVLFPLPLSSSHTFFFSLLRPSFHFKSNFIYSLLISPPNWKKTPMAEASSSTSSTIENSNSDSNVSSPAPAVQENRQTQQQSISYHVSISLSDVVSSGDRDEALSCLVILVTFWFFGKH